MKDKLGTRQLPTAELLLKGSIAYRVGEPGRGIREIGTILNITWFHNAINSVAAIWWILALARDYSERRVAFGKKLNQHPLHVMTLFELEASYWGNLAFVFHVAETLQSYEDNFPSSNELYLRALTPLVKLFTAKEAVRNVSEGLECFGGVGYMENSGIPVILWDTQVYTIWEGTTNVLSLEFFKIVKKNPEVTTMLLKTFENLVEKDLIHYWKNLISEMKELDSKYVSFYTSYLIIIA